jgi:hypothetical protein
MTLLLGTATTSIASSTSTWRPIDRNTWQPQNLPPRPLTQTTTTTATLRGNDDRNDSSNSNSRHRDLLEVSSPNKDRASGKKELLVIRIESPDGSTTASEAQLFNDIFDDEVNISKQYEQCSHGKLKFQPARGKNIHNGVTTVMMSKGAVGRNTKEIYNELSTNAVSLFGRPLQNFDEVMLCMPKGTTLENSNGRFTQQWIAFVPGEYPYYNFLSIYNDEWCSSVSAGMHEIGHTLGLQHANEAGFEYEDNSGQMGFSVKIESEFGPVKCFNPSNSWHLGWYSQSSLRINPLLDAPFWTKLTGVGNSGNTNSNVIVQIPNGQTNIYLGYNRPEGYNTGTPEGRNKVMVTEQKAGGDQMTSLLTKLKEGGSYVFENYLESGRDLVVKMTEKSNDNQEAILDVYFQQNNNDSNGNNNQQRKTSVDGCPENQVRFEITLVADAYASDSSWELVRETETNSQTVIVVASKARGTFANYQTHDDLVCIDRGETYKFTLFDKYGDGICCSTGWGSYSLFLDGRELFRGGEFGSNSDKVTSVSHVFTTELANENEDDEDVDVDEDGDNNNESENCHDNPSFRYKGAKKCSWVASNPENHCNKTWQMMPISQHCPSACGKCPLSEDRGDCVDDPSFGYKGKMKWNCSWVGRANNTNKIACRCQKPSIASACPVTCGTCTSSFS